MVLLGSIVIYSHALKLCLSTWSLPFKQGQLQAMGNVSSCHGSVQVAGKGQHRGFSCQTTGMEMCRWLQRHLCRVTDGEREYSLQRKEERPWESYKLDARKNTQHLTHTFCHAVLHSSSKPQAGLPSPFLSSFPIQILGWLTVIRSLDSALSLWQDELLQRRQKMETRKWERDPQLHENVEILPPVSKSSW